MWEDHRPLQTFSLRKKEKQRKMKVFIWFLFFLPIVYAAENYDYFQLVQQWPPTVCRAIWYSEPPEPQFTVLGLWPSDSCRPEPPQCHGSPFNLSEVHF